ncbi:MAG: RIP metalloprotease RseP [Candidatus Doudnabacteria bacterium]|nr:RIP metalloprotease RseP [Candidatus Doudnabacteria bacterium]
MIITILIFIAILGLLVFVHELGHFLVAKKSGMAVHEFGFGFPPRVVGIQKIDGKWKLFFGKSKEEGINKDTENTIYSINLIPLGGFVRIMGENNEHAEDGRSFINKPFWSRFFTLVAGVVMNWFLAGLLFSIILMVGFKVSGTAPLSVPAGAAISEPRVTIARVLQGSPAEKAGLKRNDVLLSLDGRTFENASEARKYLLENKGRTFDFEIERGSEDRHFQVESLQDPGENQGPTGISIDDLKDVRVSPVYALVGGYTQTFVFTKEIFSGLGKLFVSKQALNDVGGPVKIGQLVGEVRHYGILPLTEFTAFLSLNLAVLNILPFPALDGGRILFLIIEKVRGKKNNQKVEQFFNAAGFALLLVLMVVVTIKDLVTG